MTDSEKMDLILAKLQGMEDRMQRMEDRMQRMESDIQTMKSDIQTMKSDIQTMESKIKNLEQKVTGIEVTLENEIRVNIKRIAEGHLDLSRALHEVMRPNNEMEMLSLRVTKLETEVRELKKKSS